MTLWDASAVPSRKIWSRTYYEYFNCLFVIATLFIYYLIGGYGFPDYANYIVLVENGGFLFSTDDYVAEWLSRLFLKYGIYVFNDARTVVDAFVLCIQSFYVVFIFWSGKQTQALQRGWFFYTLVFGPLLITTALRASPAYIIMAFIAATDMKFGWKFILLALLAMAFHDSAIIVATLYVLACVYCYWFKWTSDKLISMVMGLILLTIILSQQIAALLLVLVSNIDIGARSIYFQGSPDASLVKRIFMLLVWVVSYGATRNKTISLRSKVFICLSLLFASLSFTINEVVGIRFALYALGAAILTKGAFISTGTSRTLYKQIDVVFAVIYFIIIFLDIFRNARVG